MDKELFDYTAERAKILAESDASKQETKDAAQAWLDATAGADDAAVDAATKDFLDFLEGRPTPIDGVIAFAQGAAVEKFGKEAADKLLADSLAHKEKGGKYCTCPSCTAASEILAKHGRIEL